MLDLFKSNIQHFDHVFFLLIKEGIEKEEEAQ